MVSTDVLDDDRLDETFAALANPTRRAIVARLAEGEASVNELAAPFALTLPAISKHIKVLERAGIVVRSRRAQSRPCALRPEAVEVVSDWVATQRPVWEARLDRMADHLERAQVAGGTTGTTGTTGTMGTATRTASTPDERASTRTATTPDEKASAGKRRRSGRR